MQQATQYLKAYTRNPTRPSNALIKSLSEPTCKTCKGIGRVYIAQPDERVPFSAPCPKCGRAEIARDLQSVYPLPADWRKSTLDSFEPVAGEERMVAHARRYAANPQGWFVTASRTSGTGKTLMLVGIMNALAALGQTVVYLPARTIADLIYRALEPGADFSLQRLENDMRYVDLLIIDELCKVDWSKTFVHDTFFNIFNWRYAHRALTAVAFNDDNKIPAAMYSRLNDGMWGDGTMLGGIIHNTAEDMRLYNPPLQERPL